jgi:hypothetical protein
MNGLRSGELAFESVTFAADTTLHALSRAACNSRQLRESARACIDPCDRVEDEVNAEVSENRASQKWNPRKNLWNF